MSDNENQFSWSIIYVDKNMNHASSFDKNYYSLFYLFVIVIILLLLLLLLLYVCLN